MNSKCEVCLCAVKISPARCLHRHRPEETMYLPEDGSLPEWCPIQQMDIMDELDKADREE